MPQDNAGTGRKSSEAAHVPEGAPVEKAQTEDSSAALSMADALGIPAEIQEQLGQKSEVGGQRTEDRGQRAEGQQADADDGPTLEEEEGEEGEGEPRKDSGLSDDQEVVGEEEGEEEHDEQHATAQERTVRKLQRQVDKLTKRWRGEEERSAALEERLEQSQANGEQNRGSDMAPTLDNVRTERELNQMVNAHEARLEFCDAHAEGVEGDDHTRPIVDEKGKVTGYEKKFYEPAEIAKIRRESERTLLKAERTRGRIREFGAQLQKWNGTAKEIYPELFPTQEQLKDQDASEEYYYAVSLVQAAPQIFGSLPEANMLLGDLAFAKKCRDNPAAALQVLQKRAAAIGKNGSQPSTKNPQPSSDIPPLLRKKQPPLAPHTAGRPSGQGAPSAARKTQEAMNELVADPDGGAEALAKVFASQETATPGRRTPVGAAT